MKMEWGAFTYNTNSNYKHTVQHFFVSYNVLRTRIPFHTCIFVYPEYQSLLLIDRGDGWAAQLEREAFAVLDTTDSLAQTPVDVSDAESTYEVLGALRVRVQNCVNEAIAAQSTPMTTSAAATTTTTITLTPPLSDRPASPSPPQPQPQPQSGVPPQMRLLAGAASATPATTRAESPRGSSSSAGARNSNSLRSAIENKRLYVRSLDLCSHSYKSVV